VQILLARPGYDLIHAHLGNASILAGKIGRLLNIEVLTSLHGFQKAKHYKNITHFTAVSKAVKNHFVDQGLNADNIAIIHNGFDPQPPDDGTGVLPALLDDATRQERFVIGTVGTFSTIKRHNLIIDAMARLVVKHPDILLLIAGAGKLEGTLKSQITTLKLQDNVRIVGFIDDLSPFYRSLDLYAQTSLYEGFCMPILEAMAVGVPVLTTDNKGTNCYTVDGRNAIITPDDTLDSIVENINRVIENPDRARSLSVKAQEDVQHLTWDSIAVQYEKHMQQILNDKRG
jgi:glycosyltransferase involved in cell wall biosynthesis